MTVDSGETADANYIPGHSTQAPTKWFWLRLAFSAMVIAAVLTWAVYNVSRLFNPNIDWTQSEASTQAQQCGTWQVWRGIHSGGFLTEYKVSLRQLSAVSDTNVWAIAAVKRRTNVPDFGTHSFDTYSTFLVRYTERFLGGSWIRVQVPVAEKLRQVTFDQVLALSDQDVWLGGSYIEVNGQRDAGGGVMVTNWESRSFVAHYDGATWQILPAGTVMPQDSLKHWTGQNWNAAGQVPSIPDGSLYLDVVVLPSGDIWAVGDSGYGPYDVGDSSPGGYALAAHYKAGAGGGCP